VVTGGTLAAVVNLFLLVGGEVSSAARVT